MRELITDRVQSLAAPYGPVIDPSGDGQSGSSSGMWAAVSDVLGTERRALSELAPDLDLYTSTRLERDLSSEGDILPISPAGRRDGG